MKTLRPDPVDIHSFVPGEKRLQVLAELGIPLPQSPMAIDHVTYTNFIREGLTQWAREP